jgi:hypothetical protein
LDAPPPVNASDAAPSLTARARSTGSSYIISNASKVKWSGCTVVAPGQRVAALKPLSAGGSQEVPLRAFRSDASAEAVSRELVIRCKQGTARVSVP